MSTYPRFQYHLEPQSGWMNDPNGLIYYKGQYHAFYQHYPHAPHWGQMHWGHAVSDDLIHWKHLPIALYPGREYENDGGCFSGSAIEKDGRVYLFYTSVSHEFGQTQSVAYSDDGIHFTKHPGNPMIRNNPVGSKDFRDPKVNCIDGTYYMVVGSGDDTCGKVLLYTSDDLLQWSYAGILFQQSGFGPCIECPDFFQLGDRYVLMFSKMNEKDRSTFFVVGDFVDGKLTNYTITRPEWGPDFYAPQTFTDGLRRIIIGWMYHWGKEAPRGCPFAGALSIPRELQLVKDQVYTFPVAEVRHLLQCTSPHVHVDSNCIVLDNQAAREVPEITSIDILEDTKSIEVFLNNGQIAFSQWLNTNP